MDDLIVYHRALRRERLFRDHSNPMDKFDDVDLVEKFRFRRAHIEDLANELNPHFGRPRGPYLAPILQLSCPAILRNGRFPRYNWRNDWGFSIYRSNKQGCPAKIYACLDSTRTKVLLKQLITEHNHEISPQLYERYVQQRKLTQSEKDKAEDLIRLNIPPKDLQKELVRMTGKRVIMQDVHNIKKAVRRKDKIQPHSNDAQLLIEEMTKLQREDPASVCDYALNFDNVLQYVFVQTGEMRDTFHKFPEHVCIDCTYCVNDRDMPLLSFLVIDGNGSSRLVAFALISNESASMLEQIFLRFKANNPTHSSIQTFMVDKDLNEVAQLEKVFPNALCELSLFHVKKAFKKKIDSLTCSAETKHKIRELVEKMCHSTSDQNYVQLLEGLLPLHQPFSQYFLQNWDNMRERWVSFARAERLNLGDTTNNRIESYHQKLKTVITSPRPLDVCFKKILFLYEFLLEKSQHQNFVNVTKKSISPFLMRSSLLKQN